MFVPKGLINNIPAGGQSLSEPMMVKLLTIIRPQRVLINKKIMIFVIFLCEQKYVHFCSE